MSRSIRAFLTGAVLDGANVEIQGDGPGQVDMITHLNYIKSCETGHPECPVLDLLRTHGPIV